MSLSDYLEAALNDRFSISARWVFPIDRPPIANGIVAIENGRIASVEPPGGRSPDVNFGGAALLPGLVNSHAHLDLSDAAGRFLPSNDFCAWLRDVVRHRQQQTADQLRSAIAQGISASLTFGTTAIGDISAQGASWRPLVDAGMNAVVYREAIGLAPERIDQAADAISEWLEEDDRPGRCVRGISPHAPYTVARTLLARLIAASNEWAARGRDVPCAIHLAEFRSEANLLEHRSGPFVDLLTGLGVYHPDALTNGHREWLAAFPGEATLVHANYLSPELLAGKSPRAIVYCPRTHAAFGHDPYPLREFLAAGATVALGTDSLASNPDLDLLAEARTVRERFPDLPGETILTMATLNGARSLGDSFARRIGSLSPGKDADLIVLELSNEDPADPHDLILRLPTRPACVILKGQWTDAATGNSSS